MTQTNSQTNPVVANPVLSELKKAVDLWMDKTYNESEFYSHLLQIIRENDTGQAHKMQLERLMFKIEELLKHQNLFFSGHKGEYGTCKKLEKEMVDKLKGLKSLGYNTDKYRFSGPQQTKLL